MSVNAIPVPGSADRDGYDVILEFANVLNLPDQAKVLMDGTRVGSVTAVQLTDTGVEVTSRIDENVTVPSDIHAVLQQGTVLGDTYVALERNPDLAAAAAPLSAGGRVPMAQTTSSPQLEDTLASLANFIGSGSIQRAQNAVIQVNRVTPARPEVREIAARAAVDLSDLSDNVDNVDKWLTGVADTSNVLYTYTPKVQHWFSEDGVRGFHHFFPLTQYFATLLPSLGTIYNNGYWLVPVFESAANAMEAVQHSKLAFDDEVPRWFELMKNYYMPDRKYPAINITSIVGPDGRELSGDVEQILRMLGALQ
ncbi:MCE family protein [Mycolicibacterium sp. P9-22]|nr:MCE family protein [Mycolicibacterium sp. P9-22]